MYFYSSFLNVFLFFPQKNKSIRILGEVKLSQTLYSRVPLGKMNIFETFSVKQFPIVLTDILICFEIFDIKRTSQIL